MKSDTALLSVVIDDNEIKGSGWSESLVGGFKPVGKVVAPPPLPPFLAFVDVNVLHYSFSVVAVVIHGKVKRIEKEFVKGDRVEKTFM